MKNGFVSVHIIRGLLISIVIWFAWSFDTYAVSFDPNITPEELYNLYGELPVFNEEDESIYYVIMVSSRGGGRPTGYCPFITRMCIDGKYEIFLKAEDSIYGKFTETEVSGYYYDKYCFKLDTILELFGQKYSTVDMSSYYLNNYIMEIDVYMGIRKSHVYSCFTDFVEDGKGGITSETASISGEPIFKNLYTTAKDMQTAYYNLTSLIVDFEMWYDRYLDISVDSGVEAEDWDIKISDISVSGNYVYRGNDGKIYVKAANPNAPFTLTVRSQSFYNNILMGTATFKPYQTKLAIHDKFVMTDIRNRAEAYVYLTNLSDDRNPSIVKSGQYGAFSACTNASLVSYSQVVNNYNTAESSWRIWIPEEEIEFKVTAYLKNAVELTDETNILKLYGDATPPIISLPNDIDLSYKNNVKFKFSATDTISGMKRIELRDNNGNVLATGVNSLEYSFNEVGRKDYRVIAYDNVGNSTYEYFSVKIIEVSKEDYIIVGTH